MSYRNASVSELLNEAEVRVSQGDYAEAVRVLRALADVMAMWRQSKGGDPSATFVRIPE